MKAVLSVMVVAMTSSSAFALNSVCEIDEQVRRVNCVMEDSQGKLKKIGFACGENTSCQDKREEFRVRIQNIQSLPTNSVSLCMVHPDC